MARPQQRKTNATRRTRRGEDTSWLVLVVVVFGLVAVVAGAVFVVRFVRRPRFESQSFELKYAKATEVASALADLCKQLGVRQASVAFPDSHTVTVAATPEVFAACAKTVAEIDRKPKQVYVEARFLDLLASDIERLGIDWQLLNNMTLSGSVGAGVDGTAEVGKGGWSHQGYYRGMLSSSELQIVLNAIRGNEANRIFANPRVVVSSGKTAVVDISTKRPNVIISAKRTTGNGNNNFDVSSTIQTIPGRDKLMFADESFFWWGIRLAVEPYVAEDGVIMTRIVSNVSDLSDQESQPEGQYVEVSARADGETVPTSKYPIIEVKRIETEFSLKSGETAVIGGLSKTEFIEVETGVPYLHKIPLIGRRLFGSTRKTKRQREIVVLVTMGLVDPERPSRTAGLPKNAFISREYVTGKKKEPGDYTSDELIHIFRQDEKPTRNGMYENENF